MKRFIRSIIVVVLVMGMVVSAYAQSDQGVVPDVTGISVALAAARLNEAGYALGEETVQLWSPALTTSPGTVVAQAVAPNTAAETGSRIDITVLRRANVVAIYDDNDLTLLNQGSSPIALTTLTFASMGGDGSASFAGARWSDTLPPGRCVQVWSIGRGGAKDVEGCQGMQFWLTTNNAQEHFWTGQGGASQFTISENGDLRAVCVVSTAGLCEFYLGDGAASGDVSTDFVHFAYTQDWFTIRNTSDDQWMLLDGYMLYNNNALQPGLGVPVGDPTLYTYVNPLAQIGRLAPGQCLLFRSSVPQESGAMLPQCLVVGDLSVAADVRFWAAPFEIASLGDGLRRACPAASPERITVCVMPR